MKAIAFITIFVVQLSVLLLANLGMLISDLYLTYEERAPINAEIANIAYMIGGLCVATCLAGMIIFFLSGIIIYHCFNKKYSWLHCLLKYNPKYKSYTKVAASAA